MSQAFDRSDLQKAFAFDPGWVYDPVPEWWLRELDDRLQLELVAVRLETAAQVLEAQMKGLHRAVDVLRQQKAG